MTPPDDTDRPEQPDEYTRRKAKIQLGDGPDCRGEVVVEMFRYVDGDRGDRQFADWKLEVEREVRTLREELGLPAADASVETEVSHE